MLHLSARKMGSFLKTRLLAEVVEMFLLQARCSVVSAAQRVSKNRLTRISSISRPLSPPSNRREKRIPLATKPNRNLFQRKLDPVLLPLSNSSCRKLQRASSPNLLCIRIQNLPTILEGSTYCATTQTLLSAPIRHLRTMVSYWNQSDRISMKMARLDRRDHPPPPNQSCKNWLSPPAPR